MTTTPDLALRLALEQQLSGLMPVAASLRAAVLHPPVAPTEWHGPASAAYAALETRMRSRLAAAEGAVAETIQNTRAALGDLGG